MSGADKSPKDPREGRRPKDSEFYQIPPDLKKEFDILMSERESGGPAVEAIAGAMEKRKKFGKLSLIFGVLGGLLIGLGPILAVVFSLLARSSGHEIENMPKSGLEQAKFGLILGIMMFVLNIGVVIYIFLSR